MTESIQKLNRIRYWFNLSITRQDPAIRWLVMNELSHTQLTPIERTHAGSILARDLATHMSATIAKANRRIAL